MDEMQQNAEEIRIFLKDNNYRLLWGGDQTECEQLLEILDFNTIEAVSFESPFIKYWRQIYVPSNEWNEAKPFSDAFKNKTRVDNGKPLNIKGAIYKRKY